jgi:hypothetical protein
MSDQRKVQPRQELVAYEAALPQLLQHHDQQYVVIRGQELVRYFESYQEAIDWAYETYGLEPFFVKQVSVEENAVRYIRDLGTCPR